MTVVQMVQPPQTETLPEGFDAFWTLYPRHVAKKDARRAWDRINPAEHAEILTALVSWRRVWLKRGEMEYVPHPATWLNGERWTDELPSAPAVVPLHASHVAAAPAKPYTRGEMPEEVRAALRTLTGRK